MYNWFPKNSVAPPQDLFLILPLVLYPIHYIPFPFIKTLSVFLSPFDRYLEPDFNVMYGLTKSELSETLEAISPEINL